MSQLTEAQMADCRKALEECRPDPTIGDDEFAIHMYAAGLAANQVEVETEREACAAIAEDITASCNFQGVEHYKVAFAIARAIRDRSHVQPAINADQLSITVPMPNGLHSDTIELVSQFAFRLAIKLRKAERKYGYSNGWKEPDWMGECREQLRAHVEKGDPLDVAAYCAFLVWHQQSTNPPAMSATEQLGYLQDHLGNVIVSTGDEVENEDARFFVGAINESQRLCSVDKTKPWRLKNESAKMAACIRQGNYAASADTLTNLNGLRSKKAGKT